MKELEARIRDYLKERKWDHLRPGDLAKSISIEAAELLELFQWENPELKDVKRNFDKLDLVKKELADVLIYCLDMAVLLELDTTSIILEKLELVKKKYPAETMKQRTSITEPGTEKLYWDIKKQHRAK